MSKDDWKWYGTSLHFCCSHLCRFGIATLLPNRVVVSSVGAMWHGDSPPKTWDDGEEVGLGRKYETMVFLSSGGTTDCGCPEMESWMELDFRGYNTHKDANIGHLEMCEKWANKSTNEVVLILEDTL